MAKGAGRTKENPHYAKEVKAGKSSARRVSDNHREANRLEKEGYKVEKDIHENGAYFAIIGDTHKEHEKEVGHILAENGISSSLDIEGNMKIKLPNGKKMILPSLDGHIGTKYTHEIYALQGKPDARTVADGIEHSYKYFKAMPSESKQADFAITISPKGSTYTRKDIDDGVTEFKRRFASGETKANPRIYLHIDEKGRKVYYRNIK